MATLVNDIRFGIRILTRSPVITLWVILALALGIGASSAMFSVVDAMLLHPVDYTNPSQLMLLWERNADGVRWRTSGGDFLDWRKQSKSFSDLAAWTNAPYAMTRTDRPQQVAGATVTANLFRTLGVRPALGRTFRDDEDAIGRTDAAARVAMISYQLWQDSFGGRVDVLSKSVELNGIPYNIIGVTPSDFQLLTRRQVWVPITINPVDRDYHYLFVVGRPRVSRENSLAEMTAIARNLSREYPDSNSGWTVEVQQLLDWLLSSTFRIRLVLLFGAVMMVLLITCINVAGLLMTRALARSREMAVRVALGASQTRLIRQLLTENLMLALTGGAAGLGVAWALIRIAPTIIPPAAIPATVPIELNAAVVWFTLGLAAATGVIFGLAPAEAGLRLDVQGSLKEGSRSSTTGRGHRLLRQALVALQVAVALMLVVSATLMSQSLNNLTQIDPGFDMKNVATVRLFLPAAQYPAPRALALRRQALERLQAIPGVDSVTAGSNLPLSNVDMKVSFDRDDSPPRPAAEWPTAGYATVSTGYFAALRIPLKSGRAFEATDSESSPPVVVVNEAFAERYFPTENPVGKRISLDRPVLGSKDVLESIHPQIVGVVGNVRFGLETPDRDPTVYAPDSQNIFSWFTWFAVRGSRGPAALNDAVRNQLTQLAADLSLDQAGSLEQTFASQFSQPKFQSTLMNAFAVIALLLALIGIYGVNAYAVAQRRHEIGVRMELGATPGSILRTALYAGMRLTLVGLGAGLLGAVAAASLLRGVLVGVSATDPATLAGVAALLAGASLMASYLPAHRAMRVQPAAALRQE